MEQCPLASGLQVCKNGISEAEEQNLVLVNDFPQAFLLAAEYNE